MQESKLVDFNPLDILATAAALQRVDNKGNKVDVTTMTQQNSDNDNEETNGQTADGKTQNSKMSGNGICKLKVMFSSELDKMLDEHNYGNARKNKLGLCTLNTDVSPQGKDRKVIVTLVDKSGDHHVLKTIQAVKYLNDKSEDDIADSDVHVNKSPVNNAGPPEGSSSQYNSTDTLTDEINKCSTTNQDIPAAQEISGEESKHCDKNNQNRTQDVCGDVQKSKIVSNQNETKSVILNENSDKIETAGDKGHVRMISTLPADPDIAPLSQPQTFVINISHQGGVLSSQLECQKEKGDNSCNKNEIPEVKHQIIRTLLTSSQNKGVISNSIGEQNSQTGRLSEQTCVNLNKGTCERKNSNEKDLESSKMCFSDSDQINSDTVDSRTGCESMNSGNDVHIDGSKIGIDNGTFNHEKNKLTDTELIGASSSSDIGITDQTTEKTQLNQLDSDNMEKNMCLTREQVGDDTMTCDINSQLVQKKSEETMESDNCKNCIVKAEELRSNVNPGVDHCYAGVMNKPSIYNHSLEMMDESSLDGAGYDDSESPQSVISDLSQDSGFSDSGHSPDGVDSDGNKFLHSQCLSRQRETTPSSHMFASDIKKPLAILEIPPPATITHHTSPKVGKYRIGTFASVSNSAMGLESPKSKTQLLSRLASTRKRPASLLTSPVYTSSLLNDDVDGDVQIHSSDIMLDDKYAVPGSVVKKSDIEHDHDYCLPWVHHASSVANSPSSKLLRDAAYRDATKQRDKKIETNEKRRRISSVSSEKDFGGSMDETDLSSPDSLLSSPFPAIIPQNSLQPSTRHRVKLEKIADYVKTGNSDSKLKITGSFQDDYIYFLNTKSRSRRRTSHDMKTSVLSDKLLIPLPKPGDIVVPHLTDADLEAIKRRRNVPKKSAFPSQDDTCFLPPPPPASVTQLTSLTNVSGCETKTENVGDEDSKNIIDTILSMESGETSSYSGPDVPTVETPSFGDNFGLAFLPEQMNLTPEQIEILYSAMDEVSEAECVTTTKTNVENESTLSTADGEGKVTDSASQSKAGEISDKPVDAKDSSPLSNHQQPQGQSGSSNDTDSSSKCSSVQGLIQSKKESSGNETLSKSVLPTVSKENMPIASVSEPSKIAVTTSMVKSVVPSSSQSVVNSLPDLPYTSMDKSSLDIFGNELKLFPEASVGETSTPITTATNDYDAPWIVTVSMYWNDLPAIMMDNLPYVRLVDIHKQILPAKDTGILKKRCQLLGIDVKNCSEMQRYFLVQYGKAFNSKSTLIVSKEDAVSLIGYYVNPVPKVLRSETEKSNRPKIGDNGSHHHRCSKSSSKSKHHEIIDSLKSLETSPQKHQNVIPIEMIPPQSVDIPVSVPGQPISPKQYEQVSRRTRHKKINFLEMLKGDQNNNTSESHDNEVKSCEDEDQNKTNSSVKESEKSREKRKSLLGVGSRKKSPVTKEKMKSANSACDTSHDEQSESETENRAFDKDAIFVSPKRRMCSLESQKARLEKGKKPGSLKVKWTIFNKNHNKKRLLESKNEKREILSVIHKDLSGRNGHKSRVQSGSIFLDQFETHDSACVRCCTCKKFISIRNFFIHLHEVGGSGKLIAVNQPQTLALRDMYPSDTQKSLWKKFQEKLNCLKNIEQLDHASVINNKMHFMNDQDRVGENCASFDSFQNDVIKSCDIQHSSSGTRISSRKRKQKQLYPIENYSFSKAQPVRKLVDSDDEPPRSPLLERSCDTYDDSPVKRIKLDTNHNDSDTDHTFPNHLDSKTGCGSVLTLTNGPEITTFTALADDM